MLGVGGMFDVSQGSSQTECLCQKKSKDKVTRTSNFGLVLVYLI
jgi:hypothetical protein